MLFVLKRQAGQRERKKPPHRLLGELLEIQISKFTF